MDVSRIDAANSNGTEMVINAIKDFQRQLMPQPQLPLKPDDKRAWEAIKDTAKTMYWDPATEQALISRLGADKVAKFKQIMGW